MSRLMTKPTKWLCAQRRLRPAWASAQSDQSLRCRQAAQIKNTMSSAVCLSQLYAYQFSQYCSHLIPQFNQIFPNHSVCSKVHHYAHKYSEILYRYFWFVGYLDKSPAGISPGWSESSLCAQWVAKDPSFLLADSEDSDQTGRMPQADPSLPWAHMPFVGFVMRRLIFIQYNIAWNLMGQMTVCP